MPPMIRLTTSSSPVSASRPRRRGKDQGKPRAGLAPGSVRCLRRGHLPVAGRIWGRIENRRRSQRAGALNRQKEGTIVSRVIFPAEPVRLRRLGRCWLGRHVRPRLGHGSRRCRWLQLGLVLERESSFVTASGRRPGWCRRGRRLLGGSGIRMLRHGLLPFRSGLTG